MLWPAQRITAIAFALATFGAWAIDVDQLPPPAKREVDFAKDIWPVFKKHCVKCHGQEKKKSGFRIDVRELALEGGDMGVTIDQVHIELIAK